VGLLRERLILQGFSDFIQLFLAILADDFRPNLVQRRDVLTMNLSK
jgi:hypothetical protein